MVVGLAKSAERQSRSVANQVGGNIQLRSPIVLEFSGQICVHSG